MERLRWILLIPSVIAAWVFVANLAIFIDVWFYGAPCRENPNFLRCEYRELYSFVYLHLAVSISAIAVVLAGYFIPPSQKVAASLSVFVVGAICALVLSDGEWGLFGTAVISGGLMLLYLNRGVRITRP